MAHRRRLGRPVLDLALWGVLCAPVVAWGDPLGGSAWLRAGLGAVVLGVAVLTCRRWPVLAPGLVFALVLWLTPERFLVPYAPALVVFGWLAGVRSGRVRPMLVLLLACAAVGLPLRIGDRPLLWGWLTVLVALFATLLVPWLAGRGARGYRQLLRAGWDLAGRLEREQSAVADRARLRERSRIAGDMHDSLGHELSLLAVRAGALEVDPALGARQQAAARELREAAASATGRLRDVIGVLREDGAHAPVTPVEQTVTEAVARAREAGMTVTVTGDTGPDGLAPMTRHALHRVVQEALTNAAKHAPGASVDVRVEREPDRIGVRVVNSAAPSGASGLAWTIRC